MQVILNKSLNRMQAFESKENLEKTIKSIPVTLNFEPQPQRNRNNQLILQNPDVFTEFFETFIIIQVSITARLRIRARQYTIMHLM